jgi:transposase
MPRLIRVHLSAVQREELFERQQHLPVVSRMWRRLEMVRQADWGGRAPAIAAWLGMHVQTVRAYLKAFQVSGFAGLADRPRSGRPPRLGPAEQAALEAVLDRDAAGERTWTLPQLTDWLSRERAVSTSASRLSRLLRLRRFRWKRTKHSVQHKADPVRQAAKTADLRTLEEFAEAGVVDLLYLDESSFAPSCPLSYTWARESTRPLLRYEAPRDRRVNVLGAWAPLGDCPAYTATTTTGKMTAEVVLDFLWRALGGLATPVGERPEGSHLMADTGSGPLLMMGESRYSRGMPVSQAGFTTGGCHVPHHLFARSTPPYAGGGDRRCRSPDGGGHRAGADRRLSALSAAVQPCA